MKRKYVIGVGVAAGVAGAVALGRERIGMLVGRLRGQDAAPQQKQWDFDKGELRTLMDHTLAEQQRIIAAATPEERERATAFQRYFAGRRAAVTES